MNSIEQKQNEIIDEFAVFDDWMEKYEYIIDLGKDLPLIDDSKKTTDRLIEGCQSRVWLDASVENGKMKLTADSDAIITKGIISLLVQVYNNESPEDVAKSEPYFIEKIGLREHLSSTRANGLLSMVKKIKLLAISASK